MLIKNFFIKDYLKIIKSTFSSSSGTNFQITTNNNKGNIYIKGKKTKRGNIGIKNKNIKKGNIGIKSTNNKRGNIYLKSTNRNIFCTLMDVQSKKVKTSCSLKVLQYENEFNERENLFKRGKLLGKLFKNKTLELGFREVAIFLDFGFIKARRGFLMGFGKKRIKISFIHSLRGYPHNGCRPSKVRRKKIRTNFKNKQ